MDVEAGSSEHLFSKDVEISAYLRQFNLGLGWPLALATTIEPAGIGVRKLQTRHSWKQDDFLAQEWSQDAGLTGICNDLGV